jgi:hypothetical protein
VVVVPVGVVGVVGVVVCPGIVAGGTVEVVGAVLVSVGGVVATELVTPGVVAAGGATPSAGAGADVVATAGGASFVS